MRSCLSGLVALAVLLEAFVVSTLPADYRGYSLPNQWDRLGLGENIPIANGSNSDVLLALDPGTGENTVLSVPYSQGFFARGLDGRVDDPAAGWQGKGVWATYGAVAA